MTRSPISVTVDGGDPIPVVSVEWTTGGADAVNSAAKACREAIGRIPASKPIHHYEFAHDDDGWPGPIIDCSVVNGTFVPMDCPGPYIFDSQWKEAIREAAEGIARAANTLRVIDTTGHVVDGGDA